MRQELTVMMSYLQNQYLVSMDDSRESMSHNDSSPALAHSFQTVLYLHEARADCDDVIPSEPVSGEHG